MADSIGIELDSLGRAFQHQDPLLLVVKHSLYLIMPRFTYNRLRTKTVEMHITEATWSNSVVLELGWLDFLFMRQYTFNFHMYRV